MLPELSTLHVESPIISIEGGCFRVKAMMGGKPPVAMDGRMYVIERLNSFGEWEKMKRVQSFTFHADVKELAYLDIKYYDHDPSVA